MGGGITFRRSEAFVDLPDAEVPCGGCIGCRLDRAQMWAVRCVHESQLHPLNCFITLTYSDTSLPPGGTLVREDFQKFMKRLRFYCAGFKDAQNKPLRISFFACGEYGERTQRPHYHALIFGFDFPDKVPLPRGEGKEPLWRSPKLESLWGKGQVSIGALTPRSAAYTARYCLKKVTGEAAAEHYRRVDPKTGEVYQLLPEFALSSRNPAVGRRWIERYLQQTMHHDNVIFNEKEVPLPSYYDKQIKRADPEALKRLKAQRVEQAREPARYANSRPPRLAVRAEVKAAALNLFKREPEQ